MLADPMYQAGLNECQCDNAVVLDFATSNEQCFLSCLLAAVRQITESNHLLNQHLILKYYNFVII